MNKFLFPILAVVLGFVLAFVTKKQKSWNTKLLLSFSGAFLLALTLFELLPEVYSHLEPKATGLFIMCGIMLQIVLELFSKGADLLQSNYTKIQVGSFLLVFALMTPLGTWISHNSNVLANYTHYINAVVIGIFFHISTTILFESGDGHKFNFSKFISIILGVGVAYLI